MKKWFLIFFILCLSCSIHTQAADSFKLIDNDKGATIFYKGNQKVINTAIQMLVEDSKMVCKNPFSKADEIRNNAIIVGIPEDESIIKELVSKYKLDISGLTGKWEAYKIESVQIGDKSYLFVLGSDPRGVAYGVLELSRLIGVTPWIWWADVVPEKKSNVIFTSDNKVHAPSVQYRGIFLNDEDWALMPWSTRTFEPTSNKGAIGPKTYGRIFELLLRLRANTIWPAMHECTIPFFFVEGNKEIAEKYGMILSTSHAEPMMRTNTGEWDNKKYGAFNFLTNKDQVLSYWEERVRQMKDRENIYTIGMRGIHDGRMQGVKSLDEETQTLHKVIGEQRSMLQRNNPQKSINSIPQIFVPYKEVLTAYDNGLILPEDVTLVWCDDNNGHIMRLSNPEEQKRSGGAGVYYHVSYWGKPHDYLWLGSTQPALIYSEMKRAWDNGARRLWVLNVGDIKPNEYLTEFFLDMAWDINSLAADKINAHRKDWINKVFNGIASDKIDTILGEYYHLAGERKPEHMGWNQVEDWSIRTNENRGGIQPVKDSELSPFYFGDEMSNRIDAYDKICSLSTEVMEKSIPKHLKPAYFQLVHYQVAASAAMNRKILYAQKSRFYAGYGLPIAEEYARKAVEAYNKIAALNYKYNKDILNGKWELIMDMKPRDLPVFQEPQLPPLTNHYNKDDADVVIWAENRTIPVMGNRIVLPRFSGKPGEKYQLTIHPKSKTNIIWKLINKPAFIEVKERNREQIIYEKTLIITASNQNSESGSFQLLINGKLFIVAYEALGQASQFDRYTESNQMIALNASDYTNGVKLETIEGLGHSGSTVRLPPVKKVDTRNLHAAFKVTTVSHGPVQIKVGTIPKHAINGGEIRYAIAIDNQKPQIISTSAAFLSPKWAVNVLRNQSITIVNAHFDKPGEHFIRIYALDEDILLDQLMVEFNNERKHYLIPAE